MTVTDSDSSSHETFSYSIVDQIDQICDKFESELRCGSNPVIEDYLTFADTHARHRLLRDLVAIDFQFAKIDGKVEFSDYLKRFPEAFEVLTTLQRDLDYSSRISRPAPPANAEGENTINAGSPLQIRNFQLLEVAGTGGFGTVYRAMDLRLQREVAVKIPRTDRAGRIDLSGVMREARVAAKLRHPNIVSVHEVGEENGSPFIVTDYIDGVNLKDWKKKNSISPFDAARLVAKLAVAVHYAHENGVIHRDLKLANVLMDSQNEPHVADFGLAKGESRDDSLAVDGQVLGTPAYMAPEQARADHESIDRRTDVYSIGVILYELITDKTPFRGDLSQLLRQILEVAPVAPRSIKTDIPKDLEAICLKCMAKDNSQRYKTAQALADDIYLFLNGESLRGIPVALPNRVWKWFRRNRRFIVILSSVALVVAFASAAFMSWRSARTKTTAQLIPVQFITEPPGCEITAIAIDSETGEPDPTKIQKARGRTPLKMSLPTGDYLITAVLNSQRFHEVYRHIPAPDEPKSFVYVHMNWRKLSSSLIELPPIRIPRPDVSIGMGFCEGSDRVAEPTIRQNSSPRNCRVPSFYVDLREVSNADLKVWKAMGLSSRAVDHIADNDLPAKLHYYHWVDQLEAIGKRPPSAAELYYLSNVVCPDSATLENESPPCILNDRSRLEGIHTNVLEWTSTKPSGPFSCSPKIPIELGSDALSRMIGAGDVQQAISRTQSGFIVMQERRPEAGIRGVRSASPRCAPQDFASTVDGK